jgi:hypothetical protein
VKLNCPHPASDTVRPAISGPTALVGNHLTPRPI